MKVIELTSGIDLLPTSFQDASFLERLADRKAQYEKDNQQFTLSDKMTPGLGYDDRLTKRLKLSKNTIKKYIEKGELAAKKLDGKVIVLEKAIRRFLAPSFCVDSLPGLTGKVNISQLALVESVHLPPYAVRLAPEAELCRRAHEIVEENPELADEMHFLVHQELQRRTANTKAAC